MVKKAWTSKRAKWKKGEDPKYFINGLFNIVDGAFLSGFFLSELPGTNIVIGPYPLNANDVELIKSQNQKYQKYIFFFK